MKRLWRGILAVMLAVLFIALLPVIIVGVIVFIPIFGGWQRYRLATSGHPWHWLRARLGWGRGVAELAQWLDMEELHLRQWTPRYVEAHIPKRNGQGMRRLLIPDKQTKKIQRAVLHRLLKRLNAHPAACGFERGKSIVDNARPHAQQAVVVRMDICDFFPSIRAERVEQYFRRIGWNRDAAALLVKWTTHEGALPQGAPTSPRLSNLVNYFLDVKLSNLAARRRGAYTRYADDITFSFPRDYPRKVRGLIQQVRILLGHHGYELHQRRKLHIRRRHQQQRVTGLVVNDGVRLPRKTRRWLRAVKHRIESGTPASLTPDQLQGWLAFEHMVEER